MKASLLSSLFIAATFDASANAATVILDTTTISCATSGTPGGTMSGSWSAPLFSITDSSSVNYFTVELSNLTGSASSMHLDSYQYGNARGIAFCWNPSSCVNDIFEGATATLNMGSSEYDFMQRLIDSHYLIINSGSFTATDTLGLSGEIIVNAYGQSLVPVPPAIWLFGSGLLGLIGVAKRKLDS